MKWHLWYSDYPIKNINKTEIMKCTTLVPHQDINNPKDYEMMDKVENVLKALDFYPPFFNIVGLISNSVITKEQILKYLSTHNLTIEIVEKEIK